MAGLHVNGSSILFCLSPPPPPPPPQAPSPVPTPSFLPTPLVSSTMMVFLGPGPAPAVTSLGHIVEIQISPDLRISRRKMGWERLPDDVYYTKALCIGQSQSAFKNTLENVAICFPAYILVPVNLSMDNSNFRKIQSPTCENHTPISVTLICSLNSKSFCSKEICFVHVFLFFRLTGRYPMHQPGLRPAAS